MRFALIFEACCVACSDRSSCQDDGVEVIHIAFMCLVHCCLGALSHQG